MVDEPTPGATAAIEARSAVDVALAVSLRGDLAMARAWMNHADRLLLHEPDARVANRLDYLRANLEVDATGDPAAARSAAARIRERGAGDATEACLAVALDGIADIREAHVGPGFAALDDAVLSASRGDVERAWGDDVRCTMIHLADMLGDRGRMRDWIRSAGAARTAADDPVHAVHRLQVRVATGDWDDVDETLAYAADAVRLRHGWLAGEALHLRGDVLRMRGASASAAQCYASARELGRDPEPGDALLTRDRQGPAAALAQLRVFLAGADRLARARVLVDASTLATEARGAGADAFVAELAALANAYGTDGLRADALVAQAAVAARSDPDRAARSLEAAIRVHGALGERPRLADDYERLARVLASRRGAERAAAEAHRTSVALWRNLGIGEAAVRDDDLTVREREVLRAVAHGSSNRAIGVELHISVKTVDRHVSNVYRKIGVSSRAAAVAWALRHGVADAG